MEPSLNVPNVSNEADIAAQRESFVNIGLYNWRALRADWNKRPDDYSSKPRPRKLVDHDRIFEELTNDTNLTTKVPLPDFIHVLNEVWEADGII